MSAYVHRLDLFESAVRLILSRKRVTDKEVVLDALQHYPGRFASQFFSQALLDSDSRVVRQAKKWLIYYAYRLHLRTQGKQTKKFLKSVLRSDDLQVKSLAKDAFSPQKRYWEFSFDWENADEGVESTERSELDSESPMKCSRSTEDIFDEQVSQFVQEVRSIFYSCSHYKQYGQMKRKCVRR